MQVYSNGTVRVGGRDALHGTVPHTEQPGGCGEPGSHIQLDQAGLADRTGTEFLHHWARLRYGVFEEHGYPGDPRYPAFFYRQTWTVAGQSNSLQPSLCTNTDPIGFYEDINTRGPCGFEAETGLPDRYCRSKSNSTFHFSKP